MQKLILPLTSTRLTASIKTPHYRKMHGFDHYGADMVNHSDYNVREFKASGEGIVRDFGYDYNCGNVLIIEYKQAYNHFTNQHLDIVIRYFHLAKVLVTKGQKVTQDAILGTYGMTGEYGGSGPHIHMEIDIDTKYIWYTPTLSNGRYLLKGRKQGAHDKSLYNPLNFMHTASGQSYTTNPDKRYIRDEDLSLPKINDTVTSTDIKVGDYVMITGDKYATNVTIPSWAKKTRHEVSKVDTASKKILLGASNGINSWVYIKDVKK